MNSEMNGKAVEYITWICGGEEQLLRSSEQNGRLTYFNSFHGSYDENWIIQTKNEIEVARHNCRNICTIRWADQETKSSEGT